MTQTARLIAFIKANPGASSLEITLATKCVNVTGRISDARAQGVVIDCRKVEGVSRYFLNEKPVQLGLPL